MLSCEKITELCSRELESRLGIRERAAMQAHLMMCSGCTNFRKQMKLLRRVAHEYADGRGGPADLTEAPPNSDVGP